MSNTDSFSLLNKNVPSVLLSSGGFDEHRTVLDKVDLIDFEHLRKATVLLHSKVKQLGEYRRLMRAANIEKAHIQLYVN
jgi:predicted methyltransferase MtxX (methanogen marker protein 4)